MNRKVFYLVGAVLLVITFGHAIYRTSRSGGDDYEKYPSMSKEERLAELEALREEVKKPVVDPYVYFATLVRYERLDRAMQRARMVHDASCRGYCGSEAEDHVGLKFLMDDYVNSTVRDGMLFRDQKRFAEAKERSGYDPFRERLPSDPLLGVSWFVVYLTLLAFTFGHFTIRIESMGGSWFVAMGDIRFWFWLVCCPFGVFKYPTEVDVKAAYARAKRYAVGLLSASLSLASVGCVGKRVKTEPNGPQDDSKTWVVNVDTVTWPSYLGADGAIFHPAPVEQSSATLAHKSGLYTSTWTSVPLSRTNLSPNFGREIDGSVGWSGKILRGSNFSFDTTLVGVTPIARHRGDVLQFTASLGRSVKVRGHTVSPYFTYRHATPTVGKNPGSGTFFIAGASTGFRRGKISGGLRAEVMTDSGAFGFSPGQFVQGGGNIGTSLSKRLRLEFPWRFSVPVSPTNDGRKSEAQVGLRVAWQN